jgi:hypothetical protein
MKTITRPTAGQRSHRGFVRTLAVALAALVLGATISVADNAPALANSSGSSMYTRSSSNELLAYSRVIRLAHNGNANGTLLGSFEHADTTGGAASLLVRRSADDGATWSTAATLGDPLTGTGHPSSQIWQPFFYELPAAVGGLPAGTLLLVANIAPGNNLGTSFVEWRSTDGGSTWSYVSNFQNGGGTNNGIWEPFLSTDSSGRLLAYFSDERQGSTYSQKLVHIVSTDGGVTWSANPDGSTRVSPGLVNDVASSVQSDRPGMVTTARTGNGTYVMAYETCGPTYNCGVHIKTSPDGDSWGSGPSDIGTTPTTTDGRTLAATPYLAWTPTGGPSGQLLLAARTESGGESGQVIFLNRNNGAGSWSWTPAPFDPTGSATNCSVNYSPDLLVSASGQSVRYTAPTVVGSGGCAEGTAQGNVGVLPYSSTFDANDSGWIDYNGCWSASAGLYSESCGGNGGNKAIAGSTAWTDYTLQGDVRINSGSEAGFVVRVTNPSAGADALNGYYIGVTSTQIILGRQANSWTPLTAVAIPGGLALSTWYHLTVQVVGCSLVISGAPAGSTGTPTALAYTDSGCSFTSGAVGVRDYNSTASWRNVTVTAGGTTSTSTAPYVAPFASGTSAGWTTYGGAWAATAATAAFSDATGASGDKAVAGSTAWTNYSMAGDVQLGTPTGGNPNAGLLVRVTSPSVGVDALNGYFAGVSSGTLFLGRETNSWTSLASTNLPVPLAAGSWYHITVEAVGCLITATGVPAAGGTQVSVSYNDVGCTLTSGAIGLRTFNSTAAWRTVTVSARP